MEDSKKFKSDLQRQVDEAVRITSLSIKIIVMNTTKEWHQAPIVRVVPSTCLNGHQGYDQAQTLADRGGGRRTEGGGRGV